MIRRLAAAAIAPLALTTLAACGGDDDKGADMASSETSESADAPEPAADGPTEGEEVSTEEFMEIFRAAWDDATTSHMAMEMESAGGEMTAEGDADYTGDTPALAMTMAGSMLQGQDVEVRLIDGIMYMKMAALGEKFLRVDVTDPSNPLGPQLTKQLDPQTMFDGFADSIETVVYEGEGDVDGDPTDDYSVTVGSAAVLGEAGKQLPPGVELPEQITYEVSFNDDGLLRRVETDMGDDLGEVAIDMTDWGTNVTIEAPPKNQVTEFPGSGTAKG